VNRYSYWLDTVPRQLLNSNPESLPSKTDVAIIGAGYSGLSAACRLAEVGASVLVIERDMVGSGASSRNAGQVLTGLRVDPETLVARYGETRARELFDLSMEALGSLRRSICKFGIECEFERTGHIQAAAKPAHFQAFRREAALLTKTFGREVRLVARAEQRTELGSDRYFGLLIDDDSAAINPVKYVAGLASAARARGAIVQCGRSVQRLLRGGRRWTVVTDRGDIDAGDVLVATDAYTNGAAPFLQRRLIPIGSYIVVTAPLEPATAAGLIPKGRMVFDSKRFLYYFRMASDRRLLFGGRAEFSAVTDETAVHAAQVLRRGMIDVFPQLRGVAIDYAWGGKVAFTRDQMPRAGSIDGAYYAAGYCGHGIAMSTYLGDLVARRIAGEPLQHRLFDDRFAPVPLYMGRPWFLPLVGAYYRFLDFVA
jgi:glycine/D-amino acid oxidase-like deaminating enzyme